MLYVLYNPDGSIHQANKVYDPDTLDYDKQLADMGHVFCKVDSPGLLSPDHFYVDAKSETVAERPVMPIEVSKTKIVPGDQDSAVLTGIPKKASARITSWGVEVYPSFNLDATELEVSIPVPCVYHVEIALWPFKTFSVDIEAAAP